MGFPELVLYLAGAYIVLLAIWEGLDDVPGQAGDKSKREEV